jgi:hypothetical protein
MIEFLPAPEHILAAKVTGTLDGTDYDRIIAEVESKLKLHDRVGAFVDVLELKDLTFEAGMKEAGYSLRKLGDTAHFPRLAILTDKTWLQMATKLAKPLIPFAEVRTFKEKDRDAALDWVAAVKADADRKSMTS